MVSYGSNEAARKVQVDNARGRVTEWCFAPGAATGYYCHEYDHLVVPGTDGEIDLVAQDGRRPHASLLPATAHFRNAGVGHGVVIGGMHPMTFFEVKLKARL